MFKRRPQFSLATMLLAVTVLCIATGFMAIWLSLIKEEWRAEQTAIAAIRSFWGKVHTERTEARFLRHVIDEKYLQRATMVTLHFPGSPYGLPSGARDACMSHLKTFKRLQKLLLEGSEFSDRDLHTIDEINGLKELYCANARITNSGIEHLSRITSLEVLDFANADGVDGKCFSYLERMPNLREISITSWNLWGGGVDRFRKRHPNIKVQTGAFTMFTSFPGPDDPMDVFGFMPLPVNESGRGIATE